MRLYVSKDRQSLPRASVWFLPSRFFSQAFSLSLKGTCEAYAVVRGTAQEPESSDIPKFQSDICTAGHHAEVCKWLATPGRPFHSARDHVYRDAVGRLPEMCSQERNHRLYALNPE